jgi:hypothetical protein
MNPTENGFAQRVMQFLRRPVGTYFRLFPVMKVNSRKIGNPCIRDANNVPFFGSTLQ